MDPTTNSKTPQLDGSSGASSDDSPSGTGNMTMLPKLRILSYNTTGFGQAKCAKVNELSNSTDILFLQEHWKLPNQLLKVTKSVNGFTGIGVSSMDATVKIIQGRPSGGCALLWRESLNVKPVEYDYMSKRICGATLTTDTGVLLLLCVYFPTDPGTPTLDDDTELSVVLSDIQGVCDYVNASQVIIGGDLNCDFRRGSGFVKNVVEFISERGLSIMWNTFPVDFTYMHTDKTNSSIIDHFLVSGDLVSLCPTGGVDHSLDDGIFHSPIFLHVDIGDIPCRTTPENVFIPRMAWYKASAVDINRYRTQLEQELAHVVVPDCVLYCDDWCCVNHTHSEQIREYYSAILNAMLQSSDHIPKTCKPEVNKRVPGWNTYVKPFQEESIYWRRLYDSMYPNASELVTRMMRQSRNNYHYAIRRVKSQKNLVKKCNFLNSMMKGDRQFHQEVKKVKQVNKTVPSSMDGITDANGIAEHFSDKYNSLFNSCTYEDGLFAEVMDQLNQSMCDDDNRVVYEPRDISDAIKCLKNSKQDGVYSLMTDNFIHASTCLSDHLCMFYNSCIRHGLVPKDMLMSTMVPIPKDVSKNECISDNYRAIALCVLVLKIFEYCVLNSNRDKLRASSLQFAYKPEHSTSQCTWVSKEIVSYYNNNGSDVYGCLLDCSKAFDKIRYDVLCDKLIAKGLPLSIVRIIMYMYLNGNAQVRWDGHTSNAFPVNNGVKQGSVISPLLFTLYVDELVDQLRESGFGCKLGVKYVGIQIYADDIFLLSPSLYGLQKMLDICSSYARNVGLQFNAKKTKCILFHVRHSERDTHEFNLSLNGDKLKWFRDVTHLGHHFNCCLSFAKDVNSRKSQFIQSVNEINTEFAFAHPICKAKLLQIYGTSFYGSNLWDFYTKEFSSVCKTWNVAIRRIFNLPLQTHCRIVYKLCPFKHVEHSLKCRFIKFMSCNLQSRNDIIRYIANMCFNDKSSQSGRMYFKILNEYNVPMFEMADSILHQMNSHYEISTDMADEQWKLDMIYELIDCDNGVLATNLLQEEARDILEFLCVS